MKKLFIYQTFYTVAFLLGCTACERSEYIESANEAVPILFDQPLLTVETDSRSTLKDALSPGDAFGVLGYCVPYTVGTNTSSYNSASSRWELKKAQCPPDVFYKQKVTVQSNGCIYNYEGENTINNPKYWYRQEHDTNNEFNENVTADADNYKYSFIAYYPYEAVNGNYKNGEQPFVIDKPADKATAGAPMLTFTMPQQGAGTTTEERENLRLNNELNHSITPDAMLSVLYDHTKNEGNVRFNFRHVLTALGVEINNFSDFDLTIHSLKLEGTFYKKVAIDFTGSTVSWSMLPDRYSGYYSILKSDLELPAPDAGQGQTVMQSPSPIGGEHIMLVSGAGIPFGEDVAIRINYTFGASGPVEKVIYRPGTFIPQAGVKYITQLNFVGDAFVLQFVVDNSESWEDGSDSDITFE